MTYTAGLQPKLVSVPTVLIRLLLKVDDLGVLKTGRYMYLNEDSLKTPWYH